MYDFVIALSVGGKKMYTAEFPLECVFTYL